MSRPRASEPARSIVAGFGAAVDQMKEGSADVANLRAGLAERSMARIGDLEQARGVARLDQLRVVEFVAAIADPWLT